MMMTTLTVAGKIAVTGLLISAAIYGVYLMASKR